MRLLVLFVIAALLSPAAAVGNSPSAHQPAIDPQLASQYFQEAQALCNRDDGKLWGLSLCGPILFVERATRTVVANQADKEGILTKSADAFVGKLPPNVNVANTAIEWAGIKWTMMMVPLPEDKYRRANLIAHELWHRIQNEIGFPSSGAANGHLDSRDGRLWLQLEWRALAVALTNRGRQRRQAIADALLFRASRRSLFPSAASEEREMEMHEGLAQYTGVKLSGAPNLNKYVVDGALKEILSTQTFVRSFAYASGPPYGLLLDETGSTWRKDLKKEDDLGSLLQKKLGIKIPFDTKLTAAQRAKVYDGENLQAAEDERENKRRELLASFRAKFVDGPVLMIPLQNMKMEFNPGNLVPLDSLGTVYTNIRIVDTWGILTVSKGALLNSDFTKIYVSAPSDLNSSSTKGDEWVLELNSGWVVANGERTGDYTVKKSAN